MLPRAADPGGRDVEFTNQARAATRAFTQRQAERTEVPRASGGVSGQLFRGVQLFCSA
jgi:hypothetical protein